jgi:hypothetical protein
MFKVHCSYGEIVDKLTILELKKLHTNDPQKRQHIDREYKLLEPYKKHDNDVLFSELYNELYIINKNLWDCENKIRQKSKSKTYDKHYISISEDIHVQNDKRYDVKRKINEQYQSYIYEEKIYK